jgi:hypothetical protein
VKASEQVRESARGRETESEQAGDRDSVSVSERARESLRELGSGRSREAVVVAECVRLSFCIINIDRRLVIGEPAAYGLTDAACCLTDGCLQAAGSSAGC